MVNVNGQSVIVEAEISLKGFLEKEGYDPEKVAVEKNGLIVPKKTYESVILSGDDKLEIVSFVGGG